MNHASTAMNRLFASIAVLASLTAGAGASISYDSITNVSLNSFVFQTATPWHAEDATLQPVDALNLQRVELLTRLSASSQAPTYSGFITIAVYTSVPQGTAIKPGTLLGSVTQAHTWTAGVSEVLGADFPGVNLTSPTLWVGWMFANSAGTPQNPGQNIPFIGQTNAAPAIGSTTNAIANASAAAGPWSSSTGNTFSHALRIYSVPAPPSLLLLGALAGWRRMRS